MVTRGTLCPRLVGLVTLSVPLNWDRMWPSPKIYHQLVHLLLRQQVLNSLHLVRSSLLLVRPVTIYQRFKSKLRPTPKTNKHNRRDSPGSNPHTTLYPHHTLLMHKLMRLSHHLHHLIPRTLHRRAGRVHSVRQPRSLEELLHLSDLFGYGKSSCANLYVYRVNWTSSWLNVE